MTDMAVSPNHSRASPSCLPNKASWNSPAARIASGELVPIRVRMVRDHLLHEGTGSLVSGILEVG